MKISDAPFEIGEEIAERYVIERAIAEGGMGVVFAARHRDLDELVAIKFLKPEFARQTDIIGRFAREAKASTKIKCEYVAKVVDVGISPTRGPYIVMEYLEGHDLSEHLLQSGRFSHELAVELILQACEALANAHALGIIHRDIKPENLFLVRTDSDVPTLKVLDFGVSKTALTGKIFGSDIQVAKTQTLLGTPLYMSPEQLRGKLDIEPTAEVWSIGCVLYELLTGEAPFTGASVTEVCASVIETIPRPPTELVAEIPPELEAVVLRCLEKAPERRYATVAELAVALQPFGPKRSRMCVERAIAAARVANQVPETLQSHTSLAPPSGGSSPTRTPAPALRLEPETKPQGRTRYVIVAAVVILLVGVAAASFAMRYYKANTPAPPPPPPPAVVPAPISTPEALPAAPPEPERAPPPTATSAALRAPVPAPPFRGGPVRSWPAPAPSPAKTPSATTSATTPAPPSNTRASAIDDRK